MLKIDCNFETVLYSNLVILVWVINICLLDSIICVLDFFVLTRFSSTHQRCLRTRYLTMLNRFFFAY